MSFKCVECDTKYDNEKDKIKWDSWITEYCIQSITMKEWREMIK